MSWSLKKKIFTSHPRSAVLPGWLWPVEDTRPDTHNHRRAHHSTQDASSMPTPSVPFRSSHTTSQQFSALKTKPKVALCTYSSSRCPKRTDRQDNQWHCYLCICSHFIHLQIKVMNADLEMLSVGAVWQVKGIFI